MPSKTSIRKIHIGSVKVSNLRKTYINISKNRININKKRVLNNEIINKLQGEIVLYDIANGIYSNFPLCCVLSFTEGRHGYVAKNEVKTRSDIKYYNHHYADYVQCRTCFRNRYHTKLYRGQTFNLIKYIKMVEKFLQIDKENSLIQYI
jgi:hypothetical protein